MVVGVYIVWLCGGICLGFVDVRTVLGCRLASRISLEGGCDEGGYLYVGRPPHLWK